MNYVLGKSFSNSILFAVLSTIITIVNLKKLLSVQITLIRESKECFCVFSFVIIIARLFRRISLLNTLQNFAMFNMVMKLRRKTKKETYQNFPVDVLFLLGSFLFSRAFGVAFRYLKQNFS